MKKFLFHGSTCFIGLLLFLELFFTFILPASEWPRSVFAANHVRRFDSGQFNRGVFSCGRYCRGQSRWTINAQGWNSLYEYREEIGRVNPMVALLGDSYFEGLYIDACLTQRFHDEA